MMKKWSVCGWIGCAVLASMPLAVRAEDSKSAIKPGESIGQVRLGMEGGQVDKILGPSAEGSAAMARGSESWYVKSADGQFEETTVTLLRAEDGQHYNAAQVVVTSSFFRTPAGNSPRSDLAAIWREFPALRYIDEDDGQDGVRLELYDSKGSGLAILVERLAGQLKPGGPWGKCRGILVHAVGEDARFMRLGLPPKKTADD